MGVVNVDDRSWDIHYGDNWYLGGTSSEFDSTTHGVNFAGAIATFSFTGTSVTVYGTISDESWPGGGPVSTYTLDDGVPKTFTAVPGKSPRYKVPFYTSPQLPQGQHTLVIRTTKEIAAFWLDYISYTFDDATTTTSKADTPVLPPPTSNPSSTKTTPSSTTSSSSTSVASPTNTFQYTPASDSLSIPATTSDPASAAPSNGTTKSSTSPGIIAGGVVGGVVVIIALLLLLWLLRRQRKQYSDTVGVSTSSYPPDNDTTVFHPGRVEAFPQPSAFPIPTHGEEYRKQGYSQMSGPASPVSQSAASAIGARMYGSSSQSDAGSSSVNTQVRYYHPDPSKGQQPVVVVYQPYPTDAPPSYQ